MIDPIAFQLGPLSVHWYGLSYGAGLMIAIAVLIGLNKKRPVFRNADQILDFAFWVFLLGIVLGGRLGYVLFYNLPYYLQHPLEAFAVWQGGMSFHGGLLGALLVSWSYCRRHKIDYVKMADLAVMAGSLATPLTRVANFINRELVGRPISSPKWEWLGVDFGDGILRWPSQLFQAAEGVILFGILWLIFRKNPKPGVLLFSYLTLQGALRFGMEFLREPDAQLGLGLATLSRGQWLSLAAMTAGLVGLAVIRKKGNSPQQGQS